MGQKSTVETDVRQAQGIDVAIAADLSLVPEVRHILIDSVEKSMLVWIVVDNPSRAVRNQVFQRELGLMVAFPEIS